MAQKKVYLLSKNHIKHEEYQQFFGRYNIAVIMVKDFGYFKNAEALISQYFHLLKEENTITALFDETVIYKELDDERIKHLKAEHDCELVYASTTLYYLKDNEIAKIDSSRHKGIIDFSAPKKDKKVFGWDDKFVLRPLGMSYQDLKEKHFKNHSRQEVLSKFAIQHLYFKENTSLKFNDLSQKEVIEFSFEIFDFVEQNKWINTPSVKKSNLNRLFLYALYNGGFFRSSKNRRQKNYWLPGLNAGIPMVPKKDEIHEITFFVHDLCHFVLPDLIYSGEKASLYDRVYIIYRMMSEAFSLVFADMIFVDCLVKDGHHYDFSKRKIYPLFQAIKKEVSLKELLYAMVKYCLLGSDLELKNLISKEEENSLNQFKEKYERFFVQDFKWTKKNLNRMKENSPIFNLWYKENKALFSEQGLFSIEDFTQEKLNLKPEPPISNPALVDLIFEKIYIHFTKILETKTQFSKEVKLSNSFKKYMLGQSLIFYRMDFIPYSHFLKNKILKTLKINNLKLIQIKKIRNLYTDYLQLLESEYHLIHKDDVETFKEVYPIFDSFFVFYDQKESRKLSLKEASFEALII